MVSQEHRSKGVFFGQGFRLQPVVWCPSRVYQGIADRKYDARWEITILNYLVPQFLLLVMFYNCFDLLIMF